MGHKEALLAGAMRCIVERGYAHTKARDIVEASGTNLASIGYHFGSLENLMVTALVELHSMWGDRVEDFAAASADAPVRFRASWDEMLRQIREDRNTAIASIEVLAQAVRSEPVRRTIEAAYREGTPLLLDVFAGSRGERFSEKDRNAAGAVLLALISGLMVRNLIDPDGTPDSDDIVRAIRILAEVTEDEKEESGR